MSMSLNEFYKKLPNIAFYGKRRSGKDEAAKILKSMGFTLYNVSFGYHMRHHFHTTFPDVPAIPKPVELYVQYGQAMRDIDKDVWVKKVKQEIEYIQDFPNHSRSLVNTDCRQQNEYELLKKKGFIFVKVDTLKTIRIGRMLDLGETISTEYLSNETENTLDSFEPDYVITNNGTPKDFANEITELVYKIQGGNN